MVMSSAANDEARRRTKIDRQTVAFDVLWLEGDIPPELPKRQTVGRCDKSFVTGFQPNSQTRDGRSRPALCAKLSSKRLTTDCGNDYKTSDYVSTIPIILRLY